MGRDGGGRSTSDTPVCFLKWMVCRVGTVLVVLRVSQGPALRMLLCYSVGGLEWPCPYCQLAL